MSTPIEDAYFEWLCSKISDRGTSRYKYVELLRVLYQTEFFWIILGDDNRAQDGLDLRDAFLRAALIEEEPEWSSIMCSVLEMLVAFAYKADFQTEEGVSEWFWEF